MKLYRDLILSALLLLSATTGYTAELSQRYITFSTSEARPLAMGGAFSSVAGGLEAIRYNPAAFTTAATHSDFSFDLFLNPIASFIRFSNLGCFSGDITKNSAGDILQSLGLFFKGATVKYRLFEVGFLFNEESADNPANSTAHFFDSANFTNDYSHAVSLKLQLAAPVAIGVTSTFYHMENADTAIWKNGISYGIYLNPNPYYSVGIFYHSAPQKPFPQRKNLERLLTDSINLGVAVYPGKNTIVALDVHNISEENAQISREVHVGLEHQFGSWFSLRGGYYQPEAKHHRISAGIGLFRSDFFHQNSPPSRTLPYAVNYGVVYEHADKTGTLWHFFTFSLKI
ncbi:hypothetical protein KAH55_01225 [bacterium]|nr:hypothetical protein [bacterium]